MRKSEILLEVKRNELLRKSKKAKAYANKNMNRWDAKNNSTVANTVEDYNKMDMDTFWKDGALTFQIKVAGESDNYVVTVSFRNVLSEIRSRVAANENLLDKKVIYDALVAALNNSDVKIDCSCPDFRYRYAYQASKHNYKAGADETRASKITNPDDALGAGCKHILCVLNNASWIRNVASVINNYVNYAKDNMENLYAKYIFPKIYGMEYKDVVQLSIFDFEDNKEKNKLESSPELLNLVNALGKVRGRIQKGSNKNPATRR